MRLVLLLFLIAIVNTTFAQQVPHSVEQTWEHFDARAEPLETEVILESLEDGIVLRHVRYVVGTFDGKKTRVAAFYAFPDGRKQLPGIVQLHGGGQRAMPETARFWAAHGYATVAVNWGEHVIGENNDTNTDWAGIPAGFLDPKHHNAVTPADGTIHNEPHPWNSSWLLYSAAARRAITFLEQQPEADGSNVGLMGHSMGGRLTVLTATDPRVKAASPSVGGSGYLYSDINGVPGSARRMQADLELYNSTLDCKHYWPKIQCPVMFLGATNDFNSPMELVLRGFRSLPKANGAMSFTPHMNHRFTADNYAARVRWFETHLKRTFTFPTTASVRLELKSDDGAPRFTVRPDLSGSHQLKSVAVYYGYDRDPRARFWRSALVVRNGDSFIATCPVADLNEPLFVFANVTYDTGSPLKMPRGYNDTPLLTITSECRLASPIQLARAGVTPRGDRQRQIEDFSHGWRDWSLVGVGHTAHWNYETHKVNDPAFAGPRGASLALEIETTAPSNTLAVIMDVDRWRGYTGRKPRRFTALVELPDAGSHSLTLSVDQFVTREGEVLENYDFVTSLILTPGQKEQPEKVTEVWQGRVPVFKYIRWEGGEFAARPRPYLKLRASEVDADAAFRE
ncbi:MAG: dienelactone hydrolase family protein [Planctomycetes bacterium]|nr:dienelactone hydrolase family protein [Planctomycetota bacterium]